MPDATNPYRRLAAFFLHPSIAAFLLLVMTLVVLLFFLWEPLLPFFIALLLAYFLDGGVQYLQRRTDSRFLALTVVYGLFLLIYMLMLLGPLQLIVKQLLQLAGSLPVISARLKGLLSEYQGWWEGYFSTEQGQQLLAFLGRQVGEMGEQSLRAFLGGLSQLTTWLLYLFLIPLLVFFLLKDKAFFLAAFKRLLPEKTELAERIWREVEGKMANYVRGKIWEMVIVGGVSTLVFYLLDFEYAALLGLLSGVSVLIPYVGAIGVAIPVALLGYGQWGAGTELAWLVGAYTLIQILDGNVLAPFILSEAVALHPLYILVGVLVFGSLFGFWGVFFAIPLATLVKATTVALWELQPVSPS